MAGVTSSLGARVGAALRAWLSRRAELDGVRAAAAYWQQEAQAFRRDRDAVVKAARALVAALAAEDQLQGDVLKAYYALRAALGDRS